MDCLKFPALEIRLDEVSRALNDPNSVRVPEDIQILRLGTFQHPRIGSLVITSEMLQRMAENFQNKVRGIDISVDYKHDSEDIAAGWFREVYLNEDGNQLWAKVEWTPRGLKKLAEKEFRYVSADFHLNYRDNETGEAFGPTLFGAGLTNRPVIKRMEPAIELSEVKKHEGGKTMDLEKLKADNEKLAAENKTLSEGKGEMEKKLAELEEEKKSLQEAVGELDMTPEQMVAKIKELQAEIAKLKGEAEMSEKEKVFNKLMSEGKAVEAQRKSYLEGDTVKFAELAGKANVKADGHGGKTDGDKVDVQDKVLELAEQKAKENKMPIEDAISVVLSENPKLDEAYQKATKV
jgi:phage I-like protein